MKNAFCGMSSRVAIGAAAIPPHNNGGCCFVVQPDYDQRYGDTPAPVQGYDDAW